MIHEKNVLVIIDLKVVDFENYGKDGVGKILDLVSYEDFGEHLVVTKININHVVI